jgi:hypothetical protein
MTNLEAAISSGAIREAYYDYKEDIIFYLENHEPDIANEINDFGDLSEVFRHLIGREAQCSS